jgi:hypothetical protein
MVLPVAPSHHITLIGSRTEQEQSGNYEKSIGRTEKPSLGAVSFGYQNG